MKLMLIDLIYRVGFIIMLALILSKAKVFKNIFAKENQNTNEKIFMGIFFGFLSIVGTYTGISISGAIANTRVIGVAVGGLLGGPLVGILSGAIAGIHRFLIDIGGFTSFSCSLSTFTEGVIAGLMSSRFKKNTNKIIYALGIGLILETLQMVIILTLAKPFEVAVDLVGIIGIPMIINNSIGISVFIMIIQNIKDITSIEATHSAKQSLLIADKTLKYFKNGLTLETANKAAEIIYRSTDFNAIAITDKSKILAHIGVGSDHHLPGTFCKTAVTLQTLKSGRMTIANTKKGIGCTNKNCKLVSSIVVPLKDGLETKGALKLYKTTAEILAQDIELAKGLRNLFSSQLELSRLEEISKAAVKAEIRALQTQMNPHFLFNAINTIISLSRTKPESARNLLIHLSDYFRMNMQNNKAFISLKEELNHVKAYLIIEKARFGEKLNVRYDINCSMEYLIPPLSIQPLVENAVKHGVNKKVDGGNINIKITELKSFYTVEVTDDGIGMDNEKLEEVRKYDESTGIGISNVYRRIKSCYGESCKFSIESTIHSGTSIKMTIPK
ncbi:LytS/YhcK type 5TM receptor domain-containing protein [Maledivibacter halophilus]|nr:LytS/YhcK type 5TM receptor domain-containing protein [Maledivibacter halophilus]